MYPLYLGYSRPIYIYIYINISGYVGEFWLVGSLSAVDRQFNIYISYIYIRLCRWILIGWRLECSGKRQSNIYIIYISIRLCKWILIGWCSGYSVNRQPDIYIYIYITYIYQVMYVKSEYGINRQSDIYIIYYIYQLMYVNSDWLVVWAQY